MANRLFSLFRNLFHRSAVEQELDEELHATVDILTEEKVRQGIPPDKARRQALIEIGGIEQVKESVWSAKAGRLLLDLWRDLRFGMRLLRKHPGFSAAAILTLALGIGANTAIFSAVNGILLQSLPYPDSSRLIAIKHEQVAYGITFAQLDEIRQQCPALQQIATYSSGGDRLTVGSTLRKTWAVRVASDFFSVLATKPLLGRQFVPGDMQPGNEQVAILSYDLWMEQFGGDPGIISQSISLSSKPHTIVGVMPREFGVGIWRNYFRNFLRPEEIWLPEVPSPQSPNREAVSWIIARLKKDATLAQVNAQLQPLSARFARTYRPGAEGLRLQARGLDDSINPRVRTALLILLGAVGFVLLLACVNVASLLVARSWTRQRELAIRKAFGAPPLRILRQFLAESLLLALAGGALGLLISIWGIRILRLLAPPNTPRVGLIQLDTTVLFFTMGISLLVAVFVGLAPALQASSRRMASSLKEGLSGPLAQTTIKRPHYLRGALVVVEVLLAAILTIGGALMARSYHKLMNIDTGVSADHVVAMFVQFPDLVGASQDMKCRIGVQEVLNRIRQIPGVQQTAMALGGPFGGGLSIGHYPGSEGTGIFVEGLPENRLQIGDSIYACDVTPDYFAALGIPILKGRNFEPGNDHTAIVSESFARKYFPGNPLGKRFKVYRFRPFWMEIIGVVNDTRNYSVSPQSPTYYYPHAGISSFGINVIVRTSTDPLPFLPAITRVIRNVDKNAAIIDTKTVDQMLANSAAESKFQTVILGSFGALGLILAIIGVYGVISYSVVQQTHAIGVQMALGAQRGRILRMILQKGMLLAIAGTLIGVTGALALTRVLKNMLYEIKPNDPGTFAGVAILLILVALAACYIPARQAAKSDPMTALRNE